MAPTSSLQVGAAAPNAPQAKFGRWGVQTSGLSANLAPGDDLYRYVNQSWIDATQMPAGHSIYNAAWEAQYTIYAQIDDLIEAAVARENPSGTAEKRIADLYVSVANKDAIEAHGLAPIQADLRAIADIDSHAGIAAWMGRPDSVSPFRLVVQPPANMQGAYGVTLAQYRVTGLGLPSQDYYKSSDPKFADHRAAYQSYIQTTFESAGITDADTKAAAVLDLETRFANVMWSFERLRDAGANFNTIKRDDLEAYAPGFPWAAFLAARGLSDLSQLNVGVGAIKESAALFGTTPVDVWKSYLAFHWIHSRAGILPSKFSEARFAFFDARLRGVTTPADPNDEAAGLVEQYLGDDLGSLYVDAHFREESAAQVEEMAVYIRKAFREKLEATAWMDAATKAEAIAKLDAIIIEIAKPGVAADWSTLVTSPDDPVGNIARIQAAEWAFQRSRIGAPISRLGDWNMPAHSIGMGYHQQYNKIFITAGFMLPPFFDPNADPAVNFGAIGHTLGHEFGHALDDQGSKFDRFGALRDWWSPASRAAYERRTDALIEQYGQYEPVPGARLRAEQMIGEIVGDLTGVSVAHRAYEMFVEDHYGGEAPVIDGFTGSQRFFLSTAQQARTIATVERHRSIAANASHPPGEFRVNGVVTNLQPFYNAFGVRPGARLYRAPDERVTLW